MAGPTGPEDPKGTPPSGQGDADATPPPPPKKEPPPDPLKAEVPSKPLERLQATFPADLLDVVHHAGEVSVRVAGERVEEILRFLRDDDECRMDLLMDVCGADYPDREERFEVLYHLYSIPLAHFLRVALHAVLSRHIAGLCRFLSAALTTATPLCVTCRSDNNA